jgi:CHRD domain
MKQTFAIALALTVGTLVWPVLAGAGDSTAVKAYTLGAVMNTLQVVTVKNKPWKTPPSVADAKGTFTGTFDDKTRKLTWRITFMGIGKSALTIADIHLGPRGKFGAIIVRLCSACKSGQKGVTTVKRTFATDMTSGNSWVTVKTDKFPNGVIRGQIKAR